MTRRLPLALALAAALGAGGCTAGRIESGLPGGVGGDGYRVQAVFTDVLDLVPQAAVKVDDVDVGSVEKIELESYRAKVTLRIRRDTRLPANVEASIRQTSLLGEKFVELGPPEGAAPSGAFPDGGVIQEGRTRRNPEVEEVFEAMAALLNGGGLPELQTIAVELTRALSGREQEVRSVLRRLDTFVGALDARKTEIVRAIDAMDRLTRTLAENREVLATALDEITPALTVLADQRAELTTLLSKLDRLGAVGTRVVEASREDTLADLALLEPILAQVVGVRTELGRTVDQLVTFTQLVPRAIPGDYLQLYVELFLSEETTPAAPAAARQAGAPVTTPAGPRVRGVAALLEGVLS